jgi:DNA-binding GntR family transcriptional regulator
MAIPSIVQALEEEIALGLIGPGQRLVEGELAQRFQVKRHVARQALADLEGMGLVVREPNRGASVRDYSVAEVEQIYQVRELVEGFGASQLPLPASPKVLRELRAIHARHCAAVKAGNLRRVFRENLLFHRTFFAACGNRPLVELIEQMAMKAHAIRSYSIGNPVMLAAVCEEHAEMIELLKGRDRRRLVALVARHIRPAKEVYLQLARHAGRPARGMLRRGP